MAKSTKRKPARTSAPAAATVPGNGNVQEPDLVNNPPLSTLPDLDMPEADPSDPTSQTRPLVGETQPGEPTRKELNDAALNVPSNKYVVVFEGETYPIVELTMMKSLVYLDTFGPQLEEATKGVVAGLRPIYTMLAQSYTTISNLLRGGTFKNLWDIAQQDGETELDAALGILGATNYSPDEVLALQRAAREGKTVEFFLVMALIFGNQFGAPVMEVFKEISFHALMSRLAHSLTDLVLASLVSSLKRRNMPYNEAELRDKLDLMDALDQFNVVSLQLDLYQDRGKLARFFGQIGRLTMKNIPTGTPSASTTSAIPS